MLRRFELLAPLGLVGLAVMLSAGAIRVMEVPREGEIETPPTLVEAEPLKPAARPEASILRPDPRPDLPGTLGVSLLDHEIQGPPEENRHWGEEPEAEPEPEEELGPLSMGPTRITPVPQPGTLVLVGCGLIVLGGRRRYSALATMERSSTSKARAAPGGIADCLGGVSP